MGCSDSLSVQTEYTRPVSYTPPQDLKPISFFEQNYPNYNTNNATNVNQNKNENTTKVESSVVKPKKSENKNNSNQVTKSTKSPQSLKNEKVILESDNFEDSEYTPIFKDDLFDKNVQKITKIYSDLNDDDPDCQGKVHYIYVILNYGENCIDIIEIEKSLTTEYKKHLKVTKLENECSMERARSYLEKYNSDFEVDSSEWYEMNNTTNIYIKSEKEPSGSINMFEVIYDKSTSKLKYRRKKTETNFNFDCEPFIATPEVVVQNYNLLKSDFIIDHSAEEFKPPKNNSNFGNNFGNNNFQNMFWNNNNPGNFNSQKIEKNGNGVHIKNNIGMMNNFANFGNNFGNGFGNGVFQSNMVSGFKSNFNLNQEIKVELPKTKNRGGGGARRRQSNDSYEGRQSNDSYEDNASNKSKSSRGSRNSLEFRNGSRVDKHGNIYNERGEKKGKFGHFGRVEDENGFQKADIRDNYINDNYGNKKLEYSNGEVRDADGNKLGEIRNGRAYDADGNEIGDCDGLTDGEAAYKHFYKD